MTPEERLLRYREGKLTAYQGQVWETEFPKEGPTPPHPVDSDCGQLPMRAIVAVVETPE